MNETPGIERTYYTVSNEQIKQAGLFFVCKNDSGIEVTLTSARRAKRAMHRRKKVLKLHDDMQNPTRLEQTAQSLRQGHWASRMLGKVVSAATLFSPQVARRQAELLDDLQTGDGGEMRKMREEKELRLALARDMSKNVLHRDKTISFANEPLDLPGDHDIITYEQEGNEKQVSGEDLTWCLRRVQYGNDASGPVEPARVVEAMFADVWEDPQRLTERLEGLLPPLAEVAAAHAEQREGLPGADQRMWQATAQLLETYATEQQVTHEVQHAEQQAGDAASLRL